MKLNGFKLFIENNYKNNIIDCIKNKLISDKNIINYIDKYLNKKVKYDNAWLQYIKETLKINNIKDYISFVKSSNLVDFSDFLKKIDLKELDLLLNYLQNKIYYNYTIKITNYILDINIKSLLERGIDLSSCIKEDILNNTQKECLVNMIHKFFKRIFDILVENGMFDENKIEIYRGEIEDFVIDSKLIEFIDDYQNPNITTFKQITINYIIDYNKLIMDTINNSYGVNINKNMFYDMMILCLEEPNETDYRPNETVPEDYYAL